MTITKPALNCIKPRPIMLLLPGLLSLGFLLFACTSTQAQTLSLPERVANAPGGAEFASRVGSLALPEREKEVCSQILSGNVPAFLRKLCPVQVTNTAAGRTNTATFYVTPDYLAIGSDEDYFLMPISPNAGQRIADALNYSLPTRRMVNDIYAAAEVKLAPSPIPPSAAMTTVLVFSNHNATVRAQRMAASKAHPLGALVAGHKKDVVLAAGLAAASGRVAIYGWHQTNGTPIQPLYLKHAAAWVDYSQCTRLVQQDLIVNGEHKTITGVLADPSLAGLLSDEGPIPNPRYPTNALTSLPVKTSPKSEAQNPKPEVQPEGTGLQTNAPAKSSATGFSGFREGPYLKERIASFTLDPEVKVHINAPPAESFTPGRKVLLVFFTLPNGNTTDQTIGKVLKPGDDWHYDIQHIGAQTRFLRNLILDRAIVVVYLEAAQKSWPAWRKKHGDPSIPEIIASVKKIFAGHEIETVLSSHSGGGSFIFGYLNAVQNIPNDVRRIAFLDSDYAYDHALRHKEKLSSWLKASDDHYLCVLAYNDAVALLDGKHFVSAAGGTWGKSHEMQRDLAEDFKFTSSTNGGFERFSALNGRLQFILKENPEQKIFPHRAGRAKRVHSLPGFRHPERREGLRVFRRPRLFEVDYGSIAFSAAAPRATPPA